MTRQDVLNDIAAKITSKTTAGSLSNIEDGENRELMLDYIDQEVTFKVLKRTLTHNEILNIFTNPVTLIPATAGKIFLPKDIFIKYVDNAGWGSTGTWRLVLDTLVMANFTSQMGGTSTKEQGTYCLLGNPSNTTTSFFNKNLILTSSQNPTSPVNSNTTAVVYVTYFEISE